MTLIVWERCHNADIMSTGATPGVVHGANLVGNALAIASSVFRVTNPKYFKKVFFEIGCNVVYFWVSELNGRSSKQIHSSQLMMLFAFLLINLPPENFGVVCLSFTVFQQHAEPLEGYTG